MYQPCGMRLLIGVRTMLDMDDGQLDDAPERFTMLPDGGPAATGGTAVWDDAAHAFAAWVTGDGEVDVLVRVMSPILWHVVRACGLAEDDARDVVQSTWLALVRNREHIADAQAVAGWLTITARREAWRTSRRVRSHTTTDPEILQDVDLDRSDVATAAVDPAEQAVLQDDQQRLWAAVAQLDERCRRLLRIVAFEQRPDYAAIAAELDMRVGSIGPTRSRCLQKLRSHLGNDLRGETE